MTESTKARESKQPASLKNYGLLIKLGDQAALERLLNSAKKCRSERFRVAVIETLGWAVTADTAEKIGMAMAQVVLSKTRAIRVAALDTIGRYENALTPGEYVRLSERYLPPAQRRQAPALQLG